MKKAVMYNIWYQDGAGNYIETYHPDVTLLVSYYFSGTWDYGSQRYTDGLPKTICTTVTVHWQPFIHRITSAKAIHLRSFIRLVAVLRGYEDPTYGGWGGQFYKIEGLKNVYRDVDRGSLPAVGRSSQP